MFLIIFVSTLILLYQPEGSSYETTLTQSGNVSSHRHASGSQSYGSQLTVLVSIELFVLILALANTLRVQLKKRGYWSCEQEHFSVPVQEQQLLPTEVSFVHEPENDAWPTLLSHQNTNVPSSYNAVELQTNNSGQGRAILDIGGNFSEARIQRLTYLGALEQNVHATEPCPGSSNPKLQSQSGEASGETVSNQESSIQTTVESSTPREVALKNTRERQVACVSDPEVLKRRLNWNKVFGFMAVNISPSNWRFFFIELFGHCQHLFKKGEDMNSIIEEREADKRGSIRNMFYDLLNDWRKVMGTEACPSMIEESLKERGDKIALDKFKDFMRDPPLLPETFSQSRLSLETEILKPFPSIASQTSYEVLNKFDIPERHPIQTMALHDVIQSQYYTNLNDICYSNSHERRELAVKWANSDAANTPSRNNLPETSRLAHTRRGSPREINASYVSLRGKRLRPEYDTSSSDNEEVIPFKYRKHDSIPPTTFRKKSVKNKGQRAMCANKCQELIQWENVGMDLIIELIIKLIQSDSTVLEANHYNLFLHHIVSLLIKKTGYPEETILSVLVEDYEKVSGQTSDRGHAFFLLDTTEKMLYLETKEWDFLKMYAEKARKRTVERHMAIDSQFVASKYLFIDYDGQPLITQENVDKFTATSESKTGTEQKIKEYMQTGEADVKQSESNYDQPATSHLCTNITPLGPECEASNMPKEDLRQPSNLVIQSDSKDSTIEIKESSIECRGEILGNIAGAAKSSFVLDDTQAEEKAISHKNTKSSTNTSFTHTQERSVKENTESSKNTVLEDIGSFITYLDAVIEEITPDK